MLTKRLNAIKQLVPPCNLVVDVGTDHAWLPIALVREKITDKVIASDLSKEPLTIAAKNISNYSLKNYIDLRQGDGLQILYENENPSVLILSGLGGLSVIDILSYNPDKWKHKSELILQPQGDFYEIRRFLLKNNYYFFRESLVKERGKFYQIIHAVSALKEKFKLDLDDYSHFELEYGPKLLENKSPEMKEYLTNEYYKINNILANIRKSQSSVNGQTKLYFTKKLKFLSEVLQGDFSK